jgi:hypothetical protein
MTKGKVVLVPFPFNDLSAAKVRPAVCLTDPVGPHRHVILAFILRHLRLRAIRPRAQIRWRELVLGPLYETSHKSHKECIPCQQKETRS